MSGAVISSIDNKLKGWARLEEQPTYAVTVHLVSSNTVLKSTIAEKFCPDAVDCDAEEVFRLPCWFEFDLAAAADDLGSGHRVVIGETGECIFDAAGSLDNNEPARDGSSTQTYRDAFASGMSEMDIIKVLYLDILRRPIDTNGLTHYNAEWAKGERSLDRVRRQLLASKEYAERHKSLKDAAGNVFGREVVPRSANAVRAFEQLARSFSDDDLPLRARLIRFFPGLLVQGAARDASAEDLVKGLPEREVFFRTLSRLAGRPALIIEPGVLDTRHADVSQNGADDAASLAVDVPCSSPLFRSGWHQLEGTGHEPHRWMKQIGIVQNPRPRRHVERVEVQITNSYADTGALVAASDSEQLAVTLQENGGGNRLACIKSQDGPFVMRYLVLISEKATSPFRYDGRPDPRLLSIQASHARFSFVAGPRP